MYPISREKSPYVNTCTTIYYSLRILKVSIISILLFK
nr:MAG TPA: hypothetical protein [Caudoviricetes sp.]